VLIAASTGGPAALEQILSKLPADYSAPVLVVQHMPASFTRKMAESLSLKCRMPVAEAYDGEPVEAGKIMIAPGDMHMTVHKTAKEEGKRLVRLDTSPSYNGLRPSADVLFCSVATAYEGQSVLAVILTGMGSDGSIGVDELKRRAACRCIAQSKSTCAVYGMPRAAMAAGLVDEEAPPILLATRIIQLASRAGGKGKEEIR